MQTQSSLPALRLVSHQHGELLSTSFGHEVAKNGSVVHVAIFEYPDCTRSYNGQEWKIVKDKRIT